MAYLAGSTYATFVYYTVDDFEFVFDLDTVESAISGMECTNNSLTITIAESEDFLNMQTAFDWTNQEEENILYVIAGAGQCCWNEDRQPFSISSITFDSTTNTALLSGNAVGWSDISSTYDLHINTLSQNGVARRWDEPENLYTHDLARRSTTHNSNHTIDFSHEITFGNWSFPVDKTFSIQMTCKTCYTTGDFYVDFTWKTTFDVPTSASITVTQNNVSLVIDPTLSLVGNFTDSKKFTDTFLTIPIDGIVVADIVDMGPNLAFSGTLTIGPLKGTASVTAGVTIALEDDAELSVDILSPSTIDHQDWTPNITYATPSVSAQLSAGISFYLLAELQFSLTVMSMPTYLENPKSYTVANL